MVLIFYLYKKYHDWTEEYRMIRRAEFMNKLLKLKDQHIIKVVTGVRRCGKSKLLAMFREELTASGVLPVTFAHKKHHAGYYQ